METSNIRTTNTKTFKARTQYATKFVSEWETYDVIPLKGEMTMAIPDNWDGKSTFIPILKIGDGIHVWNELPEIGSGKSSVEVLHKEDNTIDDVAFIESMIPEDSRVEGLYVIVEKTTNIGVERTAYIYDVTESGAAFVALSGNYNADNVYFVDDITLAGDYTSVGNIKLEEGKLASKGKSISELFDQIFTKELQPTYVVPSASIVFNQAGKYEVGTEITPSFTLSFNNGSYQYGPDTQVTITNASVSFNDETVTLDGTMSGVFSNYIVNDNVTKNMSASITYSDGVIANTNLGNHSSTKITANTINIVSSAVSGYRYAFWGKNSTDVTLTSGIIRGYGAASSTNGGKTNANNISIPAVGPNITNIIIALPAGKTIKKVTMPVSNNADVTSEFKLQGTLSVDGANNNCPMDYNIYKYQPANLDEISNFEITIG